MNGPREFRPKSCKEPQPYNWRNSCDLLPKHKGKHRHRLGDVDLTWEGDGPVEVEPYDNHAAYAPERKP